MLAASDPAMIGFTIAQSGCKGRCLTSGQPAISRNAMTIDAVLDRRRWQS
jgi:hypothetical protein